MNEILGQFPRLPQTALSQRCRGTAAGLGWKRGRANDAVSFISLLHCIFFPRERGKNHGTLVLSKLHFVRARDETQPTYELYLILRVSRSGQHLRLPDPRQQPTLPPSDSPFVSAPSPGRAPSPRHTPLSVWRGHDQCPFLWRPRTSLPGLKASGHPPLPPPPLRGRMSRAAE